MRTTLTIDDDVLEAARQRARREGRTAGAVLSDLARASLTSPDRSARTRNGFPLLPSRGTPVSDVLIDDLRDEEGV